ncbi:MAG: glycosyltransferase [Verrucomicrobiae bacterium]|nr:glycosyltransferase [Verrucomicrobiae bacterium]
MDFTIVTASYNYGHYIGECLESVACQQGVTFEHLVMDAGSTDDTAEVVARHPHASFFQEPDKGMSDGINKGFRKAKGEWVMWLNADDRLKPGALAEVKRFAETHRNADVIYGAWDFIDVDGRFQRRMGVFPFKRMILIHQGCYIGSTACFYRRATTIDEGELLNVDFHLAMDGEYYARLASRGKRFAYLPCVLADFRLHDKSISQRNLRVTDIAGVLSQQRQLAEPRTIRRVYGITLFQQDLFNGGVDCILDIVLRIAKRILRAIHRPRLREPRQTPASASSRPTPSTETR